ncbi:uncharacterized protein BP01DRAFT_375288 [Aspergillus saccharolyticus JOP 1030-1]|uniref:Uncharacterized protein n=1 Tax=Aspergillus saccharolyticus JOP 1030-1 TaxID=1450539 RepID=A0A318ZGB6_9EURO|nr:hypothetical protein BP01DRAFT_375288 [Aspergillus saccharolyticus JOP 1030-1]PYH43633.1 hypothetical protein BP01DRAFT_375288 [Aspergillus saccharolyticus JOP 1030-1]
MAIDDHPAHWQATLLGVTFWKDAESWNQPIHDSIDEVHDQTLHTRFPFNLVTEEEKEISRARASLLSAVVAPSPVASNNTTTSTPTTNSNSSTTSPESLETPLQHRRRYSMSDVLTHLTATDTGTLDIMAGPRKEKRSRSETRSRGDQKQQQQQQPPPLTRSSSTNSNSHSSTSLLRSALHRMSRMRIGSGEEEQQQQQQEERGRRILETVDGAEQATPTNPLLEFRGGETWARFPRNRRSLGIDDEEDDDYEEEEKEIQIEVLPLEQMFPLVHFRHLRSLRITGMVQSYQTYIWQAAWLNTGLEELELSMVCQPRLRRSFAGKWPYIKEGWTMNPVHYSEPVYHGNGTGQLDHTIGQGEYLDKLVMEKAKVCAMAIGYTRNKFSIRSLTLTGFVVDADPFLHWFDIRRLKCLNFKDFCVDGGMWLCEPMKRVSVWWPKEIDERAVVVRRVNPREEVKVVQLRDGRKVGEIPFTGPESLNFDNV